MEEHPKQTFVTEVPEILRKLTLFLVKVFYGLDSFVVLDYIQRKTIVKEEYIRDTLKVDQKYLRQILTPLKVDKFIKERLVSEEIDGRSKKITYYFINYKGVINVTKYKLDHMRQKLESKEKDEVHRTAYRCANSSCMKTFEDMDIGKIYDPITQEMKCWQCGHPVNVDETAGPSEVTRNSLAKFNEQTSGLFSMIKNMNGVNFSQEILEPPTPSAEVVEMQQTEQRVLRLGERAFSAAGKTRTELYGSGITVSIGDEVEVVPQTKEAVPWLQDRTQSNETPQSMLLNDVPTTSFDTFDQISDSRSKTNAVGDGLPPVKKAKREDIVSLLMEEEGHSMDAFSSAEATNKEAKDSQSSSADIASMLAEEEAKPAEDNHENNDDDEYVMVQGKRIPLDSVTDEIVAKMTASEKEKYIESFQNNADYYY